MVGSGTVPAAPFANCSCVIVNAPFSVQAIPAEAVGLAIVIGGIGLAANCLATILTDAQ
jgi:hypothetical protein